MMTGTINFKHDVENDIVVSTPYWKIETQEDCEVWFKQCEDYFGRFHHKVDVVFVLDDFVVTSQIIREWGEYRARMLKAYVRFSYRVHTANLINIILKPSAIKHNVSLDVAESVESAVALIQADRAKAGIK